MLLKCLCSLLIVSRVISIEHKKPNIIFIVADDLGWDDVSYHGSDQIMTPNIDSLAYHGTILQDYYTDALGTPSRAALFTGNYSMRMGLQGPSIMGAEDRGLPVSKRNLPNYLRGLGYSTHLIGKWHCGKSRKMYLPTNVGFDSFYGFLDGSVDYYTYNLIETSNDTTFFGLDFYNNLDPIGDQNGHLTELLTEKAVQLIREHNTSLPIYLHMSHAAPHIGGGLVNLQPPVDTIHANKHIVHSARRLYAGLVTSMDRSVGNVIAALAEREMLQNTIIIFTSDNGSPTTQNFGCNLPLRGMKNTPWEGAVRVPTIIWHKSLPSKIWKGLFHITDWLPTLVSAAGGDVNDLIDGIDQWHALKTNAKSKRNEVLITLDDLNGWAAYRKGQYKIVVGNLNYETSNYLGEELKISREDYESYENVLLQSESARVFKETLNLPLDMDLVYKTRRESKLFNLTDEFEKLLCIPTKVKGCLYDLKKDPLESHDIWFAAPAIARRLVFQLRSLWSEMKPRREPLTDERANPSIYNYVWSPWIENDEDMPASPEKPPVFPLNVTKEELQYLVDLNVNKLSKTFLAFVHNFGETFMKSASSMFSF